MKNLLSKSFFIAGALAFLAACSPIYYAPNSHNVPLLQKQGDFKASGNIGMAETDGAAMTEIQVAGSPYNHIGLMANETWFMHPSEDGLFYEGGIGYYGPLFKKWTYEVYGLAGRGTLDWHDKENTSMKWDMHRFAFQGAIGTSGKYFDFAYSMRLGTLDYFNPRYYNIYISDRPDMDGQVMFEPAITARFGFKAYKLQAQLGISQALKNRVEASYEPLWIMVGFHLDVSRMISQFNKNAVTEDGPGT